MENYTNPKNSQIINVKGEVRIDAPENTLLQVGDSLDAGAVLNLEQGSEIILTLDDGSQQRVSNSDESMNEIRVDIISDEVDADNVDINNIQDEISAIQDLITAENDAELPETTAGLTGNEGTSFITVNRTGDETLAQAGYDTAEQNNAVIIPNDFDGFGDNEQLANDNGDLTLSDADESVTTAEDTAVSGNVLDNGASVDGPLTVTSFSVGGNTYNAGETVNLAEGDLILNADGTYTFTPNANFNGNVPVISYTVTDGAGDTDVSTLTIAVTSVNAPPIAADDTFSVDEGSTVSGNIITHNDGDGIVDTDGGDGATLTVTQINGTDLVFDPITGVATVTIDDGTLVISADGSFTYTHNGDEPGTPPSFTYTLSDGTDVDTGNVTINVTPVNDPPIAADDTFSVDEGSTVSGNIITHNDGDGIVDTDGGDGATLTVTQINGTDLVFDPI
ncbi:MAG: retention module-containing protein, partial [Cognaticolwellia sp.]